MQYCALHPVYFNYVSYIYFYWLGFKDPEIVCVSALGLENSQIPDAAILASSQHNIYYGPERARLRKVTQGSYIGGWSPKASNTGEWIQFDLGENTKVTRIAIQGRDNADWWTTSYTLSSKLDGGSFEPYSNGQVLLHAIFLTLSPQRIFSTLQMLEESKEHTLKNKFRAT